MTIEEVALMLSPITSWFKIQLLTTLYIKHGNDLILLSAPKKPVINNAEYETEMKSL